VHAAVKIAEELTARQKLPACIVVIVCDRGDRYFAPMKWEKRYVW
jgi:cysteine synthase B